MAFSYTSFREQYKKPSEPEGLRRIEEQLKSLDARVKKLETGKENPSEKEKIRERVDNLTKSLRMGLAYEIGWTEAFIANMSRCLGILEQLKQDGEIAQDDYIECVDYLTERRKEYEEYRHQLYGKLGNAKIPRLFIFE